MVAFSSKYRFEWMEDGRSETGTDSLQWWATTDENGVAQTSAAPGKFETHIYNPAWRPSQKFEVEKGKSTNLVFHRETPGKRIIRGQLALSVDASDQKSLLSGALVKLKAVDGETKSESTVSTNKDGNFSVEMDGGLIGGYAKTANGKYVSTFFISGSGDKLHDATLVPMVNYRGRVVDANDDPIHDQQLQLKVVLKAKDGKKRSGSFVSSQFDIDTR